MFGRRRIEYKTHAQLRTMQRAGVVTSRALDAAVAALQGQYLLTLQIYEEIMQGA